MMFHRHSWTSRRATALFFRSCLGYVAAVDLWCLSQGAFVHVVLGVGYVCTVDLWRLSQGSLGYVVLGLGYVGAVDLIVHWAM